MIARPVRPRDRRRPDGARRRAIAIAIALAVAVVGVGAFAFVALTGGKVGSTPVPGAKPTVPPIAGSAIPGTSAPIASGVQTASPTGPTPAATSPAATVPGATASATPTPALPTPPASPLDAKADTDRDLLLDGFEARWLVSDLAKADSDADGLADSAEDPDGDGLGNLGEQRFGTSPANPDSDGDGTGDADDDANDDAVADGLEQDARPLPANLRPRLASAKGDVFESYRNGCHTRPYEAKVRPCVYGDETATRTVVLFGDSHALQWAPGIVRAGETGGWKVIVITKSACPSVRVTFTTPVFPGAGVSCDRWRRDAVAWLQSHPPDILLISNSDGYRLLDASGNQVDRVERQRLWQVGLSATLAAAPATGPRLVIADTPAMKVDPLSCLRTHPKQMSACSTERSRAYSLAQDEAERAAAEANGATFVDLGGLVCSYDPCPVVIGNILLWRDRSHLTATFSRLLAPSFAALLEGAVAER